MVSTDHFRQELMAQLDRAATGGRIDVLINSGELCRSIPTGGAWSAYCCDAMQAEIKLGDTLILERTNGAGMTVRYLLPRTHGAFTDAWDEALWCPNCPNTGTASLSQGEADNAPTVQAVSDSFRVVQTEFGPDFHCGTCNIPAAPWLRSKPGLIRPAPDAF